MLKSINGINFLGSPGGTMSQSINPDRPARRTQSGLVSGIPVIVGQIRVDRNFLAPTISVGPKPPDILYIRASFFQGQTFADDFNIRFYYGTQSELGATGSTPSGILIGTYLSPSESAGGATFATQFSRNILLESSTQIKVVSSTQSLNSDIGDINYEYETITIPSSDGYFYFACNNATGGRTSDQLEMDFFTIDVIRGASKVSNLGQGRDFLNVNQGIFRRNGIGLSGDGYIGVRYSNPIVTGTTLNTLAATIDFNSESGESAVREGDVIRFESIVSKTTTLGILTQRYYWNSTRTLTGATLLATRSYSSTIEYAHMSRRIHVKSLTGSGLGSETLTTNTGYTSEYSSSLTYGKSTVAIDWRGGFFLIGLQLANASDSAEVSYAAAWTIG